MGESLKKGTMELFTLIFRASSRKDKAAVPVETTLPQAARLVVEVLDLQGRLVRGCMPGCSQRARTAFSGTLLMSAAHAWLRVLTWCDRSNPPAVAPYLW